MQIPGPRTEDEGLSETPDRELGAGEKNSCFSSSHRSYRVLGPSSSVLISPVTNHRCYGFPRLRGRRATLPRNFSCCCGGRAAFCACACCRRLRMINTVASSGVSFLAIVPLLTGAENEKPPTVDGKGAERACQRTDDVDSLPRRVRSLNRKLRFAHRRRITNRRFSRRATARPRSARA